jgi:hypothetical protein
VNVRGIISGSIALIVLQVLLSSPQTGRLAGLFAIPADLARRLIDPDIPAIPNLAGAATPAAAVVSTPLLPGTTDYTDPANPPREA